MLYSSVKRDFTFDSVRANVALYLPQYPLTTLPPSFAGDGALAYNTETQSPYYFSGSGWQPFVGVAGNTTNAFSFTKAAVQSIPVSVDTIIDGWLLPTDLPYRVTVGWDLTQGVYTAPIDQLFTISAQVSWTSDITNTGSRTLRVVYFDSITSMPSAVKENTIQPHPDAAIVNDQSINMSLHLRAGDKVWISVEQTSDSLLSIDDGEHTTISGIISTVPV